MPKQTLLVLTLLLAAANCPAQVTLNAALDSLEKLQLVTQREKKQVLEREAAFKNQSAPYAENQRQRDFSRRDELLGLLVQAKMFSTSGTSGPSMFLAAPASSRSLPASAVRAELDSFIRALDAAGMLSAQTRTELLQKNSEGKFGWKIEVAGYAHIAANEEYFLLPEHLQKFADRLHSVKVISDTNYRLLMVKSARGELHRYSELPQYLDFSITIPLALLPKDSTAFLHALYGATARVMPGLQYDTIYFRVKKDEQKSMPDFQSYDLLATIYRNGKSFSYSGFYDAEYKNKDRSELHVPESYYSLFNKVLADLSSSYRLHSFGPDRNTLGHGTVGIIALTEKQFSQFNWTYDGALSSYLTVSYEKYSRGLTQQTIRSVIKTYDSLGLFSHLSPKEKDSSIRKVNTKEIIYYSDILKCFKNLVLDIDAKYGIDSGQYADITREAALISKGRFLPEKIIDGYTYEHPDFAYGFTFRNKSYLAHLHQDRKYLDPEFWTLIEKAVKENDQTGAFRYIYASDGYTEIYLTNEQFAFLQKHHLLEFEDPDRSKDAAAPKTRK